MGRIVLAYHGCDVTVRDGLISGRLSPKISKNKYDWLGDGMYFFEGDAERALKLANASSTNPERLLTKNPIVNPAVVGAILDIDRLFDLTTQKGIENYTIAAQNLISVSEAGGTPLPKNQPAFDGDTDLLHRAFDRAVCTLMHTQLAQHHSRALDAKLTDLAIATAPYQVSRGAFEQGKLISEMSSICTDTHLQLAVHDLRCIQGWFLVPGEQLLTEEELAQAKTLKEAAHARVTARKPRHRAARS